MNVLQNQIKTFQLDSLNTQSLLALQNQLVQLYLMQLDGGGTIPVLDMKVGDKNYGKDYEEVTMN